MAASRYMLEDFARYTVRGGNAALAARLAAVPMAWLCVSAITEGELLHGLARKPAATRLCMGGA